MEGEKPDVILFQDEGVSISKLSVQCAECTFSTELITGARIVPNRKPFNDWHGTQFILWGILVLFFWPLLCAIRLTFTGGDLVPAPWSSGYLPYLLGLVLKYSGLSMIGLGIVFDILYAIIEEPLAVIAHTSLGEVCVYKTRNKKMAQVVATALSQVMRPYAAL